MSMKRELQEDKLHFINSMFSKRHHQAPSPSPPSHLHPSTVNRFLPTMEEEQEENNDSLSHSHLLPTPLSSNDGASIEVVRRPRGRPPGSKNKPRRPSAAANESQETSMSPYILELPAGVDIIEATAEFCRKRDIGLCVLSGNGAVTNVTLKQPSATPGASVTFHGRFDILSISATILASGETASFAANGSFTLSVAAGPQGQVVGGVVIGPLISAATIYLVAGTFNSPSFSRLQQDEEFSGDGGGEEDRQMAPAVVSGGIDSSYGFGQSTDVMWAPGGRQAHASYH